MPESVEYTIDKLEGVFTDECIVAIVSAPNSEDGNKIILDYLTKDLDTLEDALYFCNQLEKLSESPNLIRIVAEIKKGLYNSIEIILWFHNLLSVHLYIIYVYIIVVTCIPVISLICT